MQGLLLYSMDQSLVFDPTEFAMDITPAAVHEAVEQQQHLKALLIALRLREPGLIQHALLSVPHQQVRPLGSTVCHCLCARALVNCFDASIIECSCLQACAKVGPLGNVERVELLRSIFAGIFKCSVSASDFPAQELSQPGRCHDAESGFRHQFVACQQT